MKLLLVQLDGLSRPELEWSMSAGHLPFLQGLSRSGHQLHSLYSGLPSTTPAFQGELFYGVPQCVCAWNFRDRHSGRIADLLQRPVAARREHALAGQGRALLEGGSAYCCLLSGGASQLHFCSVAEHWFRGWPRPRLAECLAEASLALLETDWRQWRDELLSLPKRVAVNAWLRKYLRRRLAADLKRGLPIIYANLLDYDGMAHLRGPHSDYARQVLLPIDDDLCHLWLLARRHNYEMWIFSDHGQEDCRPFEGLRDHGVLVADCGPLAHLYFEGDPAPLADRLLAQGVPQTLYRRGRQAWVHNPRGRFALPQAWPDVLGPTHPFGPQAARDLARLARHPEAGQLVAVGWHPDTSLTFMRERGSHGGPGSLETHAFVLAPQEACLGSCLRPLDLRQAIWRARAKPPRSCVRSV